ncbi:MAG: ATP-dependent DNA helicase RecG [Endomicrobium sp.]|jgi:ATP-dependent DNA helicase RecG|nr:ATP-dependent DNA helicase RecG [Endomicrobium sp.]
MLTLDSEVQYIKGIGAKRAAAFLRLGVKTVYDLLTLFPAQYQDRTQCVPIRQIYGQTSCVFGRIGKFYERKLSRGLYILDIEIFDESSMAYARFFRQKSPYSKIDVFSTIKKSFQEGKFAYIYGEGKVEIGARFIAVNDYEAVDSPNSAASLFNKIIPVYPLTEGLSQKIVRNAVKEVLTLPSLNYFDISEIIPQFENLPKIDSLQALKKIHYPKDLDEAENARRSLAIQEFFVLETALELSRNETYKIPKRQKYEIFKTLLTPFKNKLPFEFTRAQKKAINEIFKDMQGIYQMNRLLMGDVGSGKTVAALSAALLAVENGFQAMIAAPTDILAQQHYFTISNMLDGLPVNIALATSQTLKNKKEREEILFGIENGRYQIVVGTHSLMQERVKFKNLTLIIVDEQQRFGVMQKYAAAGKGETPDILMMTATPIPRALAMTVYGEMDMTVIDELPKGRIPAQTFYTNENAAYNKTIKELKDGSQAYIVYPLIDESDKLALKSATAEAEKLSQSYFKDFKVGLLHGKMKAEEKRETMEKFKNKQYDVLISTTVIEVGIDVPNATVMIIQNAERFGLSALHQLRGRIGRGKKRSYCFLTGGAKGENSRRRLEIMTRSNNGFEIAEEDLKMRGPGELMGTVQHGFPEFKAGDIIKDADIIEFAKDAAKKLIETDPKLEAPQNQILKKLINLRFAQKVKLINVG